ncbi:hypothetical protein MCX33_11335 [Methylorubrum extorquens]|nr:hypothetical protein [Methylorubrum extorquens]MCG5246543.1 hypothetical protein [Methylorubrum extorquens]
MRSWHSHAAWAMRGVALGSLLALTGAGTAWATEIVLPEKNPAVTLTIPDDWKTEVRDTEVVSTSPDGDVSFEVGFETRADRDSLVKDKVSFLRKQKVNLSIKPVEQVMDFGGTPARVQRYRTTDKYGKTIVDLVTLDASRDRALLMTIWGSEDQRQANEAALDTIMKSVRVPAETGGSSNFWSGGKTAAKPETKPEPKVEMKSEPAAAGLSPAVAAAQPTPLRPYATRRALYVARKAADFGDVEARPSNVFKPGEPLLTYIEPVGEATQSIGSDQIGFGVIVDFEVRTAEGKALATQKSMIDRDVTVKRAEGEPNFFLNLSLDLDGFPPGNYVLVYTLRDKLSGRTLDVPQPFTIAQAATDKAAGASPAAPSPSLAAPATPPASVQTTVVDGWTVQLAPPDGVSCAIYYEHKPPRADGKRFATIVAFVSIPDRNLKLTTLELKFSGWNWTKDQEVKATLRTGEFYLYSGLNWIVLDPRSLLLRSNDPEDILRLVKTTSKLSVERDGEDAVTFDITAPDKALEALKPCRDQLK